MHCATVVLTEACFCIVFFSFSSFFCIFLGVRWTSSTPNELPRRAAYSVCKNVHTKDEYERRRLARYTDDRTCQMCLWFSVEWTLVKCVYLYIQYTVFEVWFVSYQKFLIRCIFCVVFVNCLHTDIHIERKTT